MPIEAPSNTPIGSRTHSEFVLCEGFAFRPSNVDGCSHQTYADGSAVTIVNFKSYTQTIPDPERAAVRFSHSQDSNRNLPMKASDLLIYVFCIVGALAGYFLLAPPLSWAAVGICAVFAVWTLFAADATAGRFSGSPACPGQWRISCAAGSSPGAPDRARRNARSIRSPIRSFKTFRIGAASVSIKKDSIGRSL